MSEVTASRPSSAGHRQRLRKQFISDEKNSRSDEALLELLLTYAIPQQDVSRLAQNLLNTYGDMLSVLRAHYDELIKINGIKDYVATLIKLVDVIGQTQSQKTVFEEDTASTKQITPYDNKQWGSEAVEEPQKPATKQKVIKRYGTALFGKAVLSETVDILPRLPDTESVDEIRNFLRSNLRFNAEQTRQRNANYIVKRMFPNGYADEPLRLFSKTYPNSQELREVCFYRFMLSEPLEMEVIEDLLLPDIRFPLTSLQTTIYGRLANNIQHNLLWR